MYNEELRKRDFILNANMARLMGYVGATVKELADPLYARRMGVEWMQTKLLNLKGVMDHVWENRYDRIVDFDEYTNPSRRRRIVRQQEEALEK